jgi:hypothetical protein
MSLHKGIESGSLIFKRGGASCLLMTLGLGVHVLV